MKVSFGLLSCYLEDFNTSINEITDRLTKAGVEVDKVQEVFPGFEVVTLDSVSKHPNADSLKVCSIAEKTVVCGDGSIETGMRCILANSGALIPSSGEVLKGSTIRDVKSEGMLCSAEELLLEKEGEGVLKLSADDSIEKMMPNGAIFDLEITPNRGDLLSVYGIARELSVFGLGRLKKPNLYPISLHFDHSELFLENESIKSMYCISIKDIQNFDSPVWLKRKLVEIGIRPESSLDDICRYISHMLGQPINAFDSDLLGNVEFKIHSEEIVDENGKKFNLENALCMVSDGKCTEVLGVMQTKLAKCSKSSRNILLQAGNYSKEAIFLSENQLYPTDSSKKFNYKIDPMMTKTAICQAAAMIQNICGGIIDKSKCLKEESVVLNGFKVNDTTISDSDLGCLEKLGFAKIGYREYSPPSWRNDIVVDECLISEVLRFKGYENIAKKPLSISRIDRTSLTSNKLRVILSSFGLFEVVNKHFVSKALNDIFPQSERFFVSNPMSQSQFCLRGSLLPSMVELFSTYKRYNWQCYGIFELGTVFTEQGEEDRVAVMISKKNNWLNGKFDYFNAKRIFDSIVNFAFGNDLETSGNWDDVFLQDCCIWKQKESMVARFGEIGSLLQKKIKSREKFYFGEMILKKQDKPKKMREVNDYEVVTRDISVLMKNNICTNALIDAIKSSISLGIDICVFDVYPDAGLESAERSVGIRLIWSNLCKTLSSEEINTEINSAHDAIRKIGCTIKES